MHQSVTQVVLCRIILLWIEYKANCHWQREFLCGLCSSLYFKRLFIVFTYVYSDRHNVACHKSTVKSRCSVPCINYNLSMDFKREAYLCFCYTIFLFVCDVQGFFKIWRPNQLIVGHPIVESSVKYDIHVSYLERGTEAQFWHRASWLSISGVNDEVNISPCCLLVTQRNYYWIDEHRYITNKVKQTNELWISHSNNWQNSQNAYEYPDQSSTILNR